MGIHNQIVTMVIPTYRRPRLLRRAILSVLNQTHTHVRVCVYDNASGDETEAVVRELARGDDRVKYHCHPENVGAFRNFNYGMMDVKTPYFAVLSDDDIVAPTFFEKALQAFGAFPEAKLACMPTLTVDAELNVIEAPIEVEHMTFYQAGEALEGTVKGSIPGSLWSGILFRTEVRDAIGHLDANVVAFADAGYLWHAVARFPLVVLPGVAALYMVHPYNMGTEVSMMPMDGTWPGWWERMIEAVETDAQVPPQVRSRVRRIVTPDFRQLAYQQVFHFIGAGRPDLARRAASGLGACGYPAVSALLATLVWGYDHVPVLRWGFMRAIEMRHAKTRARRRRLHERHGHHVTFAHDLESQLGAVNV